MSQHIFDSQFKKVDVQVTIEWCPSPDHFRIVIREHQGEVLFNSDEAFKETGRFKGAPLLSIMSFCEANKIKIPPKLLLEVKKDRELKRSRQVFYT